MGFGDPFLPADRDDPAVVGLLLAGIVACRFLPISALPNVDFPAIVVIATMAGAEPGHMANSTVAAPLESAASARSPA